MTPCMGRYFGSFCYRVARRITGGQPKQWVHGSWDYPPMGTTMDEAGFEDIREYILKRQNLGRTVYCGAANSGPLRGDG